MSGWRIGTIAGADGPVTVIETGDALYELDALAAAAGIDLPGAATGVADVLERWDDWRPALGRVAAAAAAGTPLRADDVSWLPPVAKPKIVCVGANYRDHLEEMGSADRTFEWPFAFVKPVNTLLGHRQALRLPVIAQKIDWEAELAIVIGRRAKAVRGADALAAIAGYCLFNDISARDWSGRPSSGLGPDWIMGKAHDGFAPAGPLITPAEFVADPQDLAITLAVNGVVKQRSSTAQMLFGIQALVEHVASVMTLEPGDLIATGTPAGVGHARGEYLRAGDVMTLAIEGLGELETPVEAAR